MGRGWRSHDGGSDCVPAEGCRRSRRPKHGLFAWSAPGHRAWRESRKAWWAGWSSVINDANAANEKADRDLLLANPALQASAPAATPAATPSAVPRGIRNNNPLNIEDGDFAQSQPGYTGTDGRFAQFKTPDQGTAAANALLDVYQQKHGLNTVSGIVNRWAPTSDGNNTSAYASDVARQLGIDPNAPLTPAMRPPLIAAMGRHENGQPISDGAGRASGCSRCARCSSLSRRRGESDKCAGRRRASQAPAAAPAVATPQISAATASLHSPVDSKSRHPRRRHGFVAAVHHEADVFPRD